MASDENANTNGVRDDEELKNLHEIVEETILEKTDDIPRDVGNSISSNDCPSIGCSMTQNSDDLPNLQPCSDVKHTTGSAIAEGPKENDVMQLPSASLEHALVAEEVREEISDEKNIEKNREEYIDSSTARKNCCVVCRKLTKCHFSLLNKKEKKYLCDGNCLKVFKNAPSTYCLESNEGLANENHFKRNRSCIACGNNLNSDTLKVLRDGKSLNFCNKACQAQYGEFVLKNENEASPKNEKCVICGSLVKDHTHMVHYKEIHHSFCSETCMNTFKAKNESLGQCLWCLEKRTIFDMINDPHSKEKFCSLNCMSLHSIKLKSTISFPSGCTNCNKTRILNYHLKMSDSSLESFCSYPCVKMFCKRFSKNPPSKSFTSSNKNSRQVSKNATVATSDPVSEELHSDMKQLKSKSLLCRPLSHGKSISCTPQMKDVETQTDEESDLIVILPCPTPVVMPTPLCSLVTTPVLSLFPVPMPCNALAKKTSSERIIKKLKELQHKVPSDPFEAELIMAVTDNQNNDTYDEETAEQSSNPVTNSEEPEEDMLQIALRLADEMTQEDQVVDHIDTCPADDCHNNQNKMDPSKQTSDAHIPEAIPQNNLGNDMIGYKRKNANVEVNVGACKTNESINGTKRHRKECQDLDVSKEQSTSEKQDSHEFFTSSFALKFSYGVNAYKYWVLKKNAEIEASYKKAASSSTSLIRKGPRLFNLDLLQASADELNQALSYFVKEVRKPNGEEYAPDSILYLCLGIQEYMHMFGRVDDIFTDSSYDKFSSSLNNILVNYEVRLDAHGTLVCRIEEEHLWECKQLGAHSPHILINTLVYLNTKHFLLKSPQHHLNLSFTNIIRQCRKFGGHSSKQGKGAFLRYCSPANLATPSDSHHKKRKDDLSSLEQFENLEDPMRCPVKLYEFYISKCPEGIKNRSDAFYLVPEVSCIPDSPVWYSSQSYSLENMSKIVNRLQLVREIQEALLADMASSLN